MKVEIEISCDDIVLISKLASDKEFEFQEMLDSIFQNGLKVQFEKHKKEIKLIPMCDIRVRTLQQNIVLEQFKKKPLCIHNSEILVGVLDFKTLLFFHSSFGLLEFSYNQETKEVVCCE